MTMRSILLACLGLGTSVPGCFVEEPIPVTTSEGSTVGTMTMTMATEPAMTSVTGSATELETMAGPTTIEPPTTGVDSTTTEASATETSGPEGTTGCGEACDGLACGFDSECEQDCGACGPMAVCADDQTYCGLPIGFSNDFGDNVLVAGQVQFGFRFDVFEPRVVRRLGVIAGGAGQDVRLALYDHDGMGPANRVVQTGAVTLFAAGPNEFSVGATAIEPGDYWVMLHTAAMTPLGRTFNGDNGYEEALRVSIPFADGFPETMDDEMVITDYRYNVYMVVED